MKECRKLMTMRCNDILSRHYRLPGSSNCCLSYSELILDVLLQCFSILRYTNAYLRHCTALTNNTTYLLQNRLEQKQGHSVFLQTDGFQRVQVIEHTDIAKY